MAQHRIPKQKSLPAATIKKKTHRGGRSDAKRAAHHARGGGFYQLQLRLQSEHKRLATAERELSLRADEESTRHRHRQQVLQLAQQQARHVTQDAARHTRDAKRKTRWAWTAIHGDLSEAITETQKTNLAVHHLVMTKGVAPLTAVEKVALERRKEQARFEALLVSQEAAHVQSLAARAAARNFFNDTTEARALPAGRSIPLPTGYYDRALRDDTERAAYAALQGLFVGGA